MIKKIILFSGQGNQYVGMGKKICDKYKAASDLFDEASEILEVDMKKLCFESSASELMMTSNAQPAILTVSVAMYYAFLQEELRADMMAGHSLGEITALTCSGAINFADAIKIARKRGEYMQEAIAPENSAMAAVISRDPEQLKKICLDTKEMYGTVGISNYNSLNQYVISGEKKAVDCVVEILSKDKIKTKYLEVSAPFHSVLMKEAANKMKEELIKYKYNELECTVISNVTGLPYDRKDDIIGNLTAQITSPVQWIDSMQYAKKSMMEYGIEIGPGRTLKNLMKHNISEIPVFSYDIDEDVEALRKYVKNSYTPFASRCMGIAVATKNKCDNKEMYEEGVIKPYNLLGTIQNKVNVEERKESYEEMIEAIQLLLTILNTKQVSEIEIEKRLIQLFEDTGTEKLLKNVNFR